MILLVIQAHVLPVEGGMIHSQVRDSKALASIAPGRLRFWPVTSWRRHRRKGPQPLDPL